MFTYNVCKWPSSKIRFDFPSNPINMIMVYVNQNTRCWHTILQWRYIRQQYDTVAWSFLMAIKQQCDAVKWNWLGTYFISISVKMKYVAIYIYTTCWGNEIIFNFSKCLHILIFVFYFSLTVAMGQCICILVFSMLMCQFIQKYSLFCLLLFWYSFAYFWNNLSYRRYQI